ncbi:MAG: hypothetical protein ABSC25_08915 [Roseiarcus sp.]
MIATLWFGKRENCVRLLLTVSAMPALPACLNGGIRTVTGAKIWSKMKVPFFLLQAFDFPQNGRRNLWKCLEKKAANLEMFGMGLEKLARPRVRSCARRADHIGR